MGKQLKKERLLQKEQDKIDILELKKERLLQKEQDRIDFLVTTTKKEYWSETPEPDQLEVYGEFGEALTVTRTAGNVIYLTPSPSQS